MIEQRFRIPTVSLTRDDLDRMAARVAAIGKEADEARRASLNRQYQFLKSTTERKAAVDEAMSGHRYDRDRFTLHTADSRAVGDDWRATLDQVPAEEITSIRMRANSDRVAVDVRIGLQGFEPSEVEARSEDAEEVRREMSYFREAFDRRRSPLRAITRHWLTWSVLAVASWLVATYAIYWAIAPAEASESIRRTFSTLAAIGGMIVAALVVTLAMRLSPLIIIEGIGPARRLAGATILIGGALLTIALGVVSAIVYGAFFD